MATATLAPAVYKLAMAAERAGFSLEDMIGMLQAGVSVETLLTLIEVRLRCAGPETARISNWAF